jgi:hypothetical protein
MMSDNLARLSFVTCASNLEVLAQRLLASPCLRQGGWPLAVYFNATSAAQGFNAAMTALQGTADARTWLVWVHQDVFLPEGWDKRFCLALEAASQSFPKLAVAGVYGLVGAGAVARRAGHVLDRGKLLREDTAMPCLVDSLDELLFAVRVDGKLRLDPALGFDFYATDLVLQAQQQGWQCAVLDACCEHWSDTPASGAVPPAVVQRIKQSARVFEHKWADRLPISTPCFEIHKAGDVAAFIDAIVAPSP